jgi:hypothetical protein
VDGDSSAIEPRGLGSVLSAWSGRCVWRPPPDDRVDTITFFQRSMTDETVVVKSTWRSAMLNPT